MCLRCGGPWKSCQTRGEVLAGEGGWKFCRHYDNLKKQNRMKELDTHTQARSLLIVPSPSAFVILTPLAMSYRVSCCWGARQRANHGMSNTMALSSLSFTRGKRRGRGGEGKTGRGKGINRERRKREGKEKCKRVRNKRRRKEKR